MQFHILLDEAQADTGPCRRGSVPAPEETVEDVRQVVTRDTDPGIRHFDAHLSVSRPAQPQGDCSAGFREFQGVGNQVVDDLLHHVAVEFHHRIRRLVFQREGDLPFLGRRLESVQQVLRKFPDAAQAELEFFSPHLHFPEIQQMVHQVQQGLRVPVHRFQPAVFPGPFLFLHQALERKDDQAERRPELVGNVREETELHLVQFFLLPVLFGGGGFLQAVQLPAIQVNEH